jgi:myo-inositol 2-dehydrogenase/D-chiro-inositol 1-dehydrogenase
VSAVTSGTPLSPSGDDGLKALLIAEAAALSVREERVVRL